MTIQEKVDSLKPFFKSIKIAENYNIVETNLPKSWVLYPGDDIEIEQKQLKDSYTLTYTIFYSETKSFDDIIKHIFDDVISYNLELEEKDKLLKAKVEELRIVFENKSLDELNNLTFTTMKKNTKKTKDELTEELSTNDEPK